MTDCFPSSNILRKKELITLIESFKQALNSPTFCKWEEDSIKILQKAKLEKQTYVKYMQRRSRLPPEVWQNYLDVWNKYYDKEIKKKQDECQNKKTSYQNNIKELEEQVACLERNEKLQKIKQKSNATNTISKNAVSNFSLVKKNINIQSVNESIIKEDQSLNNTINQPNYSTECELLFELSNPAYLPCIDNIVYNTACITDTKIKYISLFKGNNSDEVREFVRNRLQFFNIMDIIIPDSECNSNTPTSTPIPTPTIVPTATPTITVIPITPTINITPTPSYVTPDCEKQYAIEFSLAPCERKDNILTVTNNFATPAEFYAEGDCGDEIIFNGQIYEEKQHIYPWYTDVCGLGLPLNGNHHFVYSKILQPGESITIGGRDNGFGGGTSGFYKLCPASEI